MSLQLDEVQTISDVPFGRSRLLALAGATLFGMAGKGLIPDTAYASPFCCSGGACACCNGTTCCNSGCTSTTAFCSSGIGCWVCCLCGTEYQCCDWQSPGVNLCVCATNVGGCGC